MHGPSVMPTCCRWRTHSLQAAAHAVAQTSSLLMQRRATWCPAQETALNPVPCTLYPKYGSQLPSPAYPCRAGEELQAERAAKADAEQAASQAAARATELQSQVEQLQSQLSSLQVGPVHV